MQASGIICEFNPLHNGHRYLLDTVRRAFPDDGIVCVMSGDFVQRGSPALLDKFARAQAAVRCGADLVLELPAYYAVNSAAAFACGGVRILKGLGCVRHLAFGSESADAEGLLRLSEQLDARRPAFDEAVRRAMGRGISYPSAMQKAAEELSLSMPVQPNDILALEYINSSRTEGTGWQFFPVKRMGAGHDAQQAEDGIASASALRRLLAGTEDISVAEPYVPEASLAVLRREKLWDARCEERYFDLLRYVLLSKTPEELSGAVEIGEGLENRLRAQICEACGLEHFLALVKTRRYTHARLCRILTQLLLGLTKEGFESIRSGGGVYARVLALNEKGAALLRTAAQEGSIPVISNVNRLPDDFACASLLAADLHAADFYAVLTGKNVAAASDRTRIPSLMKG